ncbi:MAG: hypothetical protein GEEBNDBF_01903 [bacterium]|nr:hypothetical protein [bacterium]
MIATTQRYAVLSLSGILLWAVVVLNGCQVGGREQSSRPLETLDPTPPASARVATQPGADWTEAQLRSFDLRSGLEQGDVHSIAIAQRLLMLPLLNNALNLHYGVNGQLPSRVENLLPGTVAWPLTPDGVPWPLWAAGPTAQYPQMWLDPRSTLQPFDLVIESTAFDGAPLRPFTSFFAPSWETETGARLRQQDFRGVDPSLGMYASNLCLVISTYRAQLGSYPVTPLEAFQMYELALIRESVGALEAAYPQRTFFRSGDGQSFGLLLEGSSTEPRLLLKHESADGRNTSVLPVGYPTNPRVQQSIDSWLRGVEFWADWSTLQTVPRIDAPRPADPANLAQSQSTGHHRLP